MAKANKKVIYLDPYIKLSVLADDGKEYKASKETCREVVLRSLWGSLSKTTKPVNLSGKDKLMVDLELSIPLEYEGAWETSYAPSGEDTRIKRLALLETSVLERQKLRALVDVVSSVPLLLAFGPKAYCGVANGGSFKFLNIRARGAVDDYDYQPPHKRMLFRYDSLSNRAASHPAMLSLALSLIKWAIESYCAGDYNKFNKAFSGIFKVRTKLKALSRKTKLGASDYTFLQDKFDTLFSLSDSKLVNRRLSRYPINKYSKKHSIRGLQSMNSHTGLDVRGVWVRTIGDDIYGAKTGYGFYSWLEEEYTCAALTGRLDRQEYSDIEKVGYVIYG